MSPNVLYLQFVKLVSISLWALNCLYPSSLVPFFFFVKFRDCSIPKLRITPRIFLKNKIKTKLHIDALWETWICNYLELLNRFLESRIFSKSLSSPEAKFGFRLSTLAMDHFESLTEQIMIQNHSWFFVIYIIYFFHHFDFGGHFTNFLDCINF
jgi:hypothetical protein